MTDPRSLLHSDEPPCPSCGAAGGAHLAVCPVLESMYLPPPYSGDEPLGTCIIHGDYWTDDCMRCGR